MKLLITQGFTYLEYLAPLYQELYQRWPQGSIQYRPSAEGEREIPLLVVDVHPYPGGITPEDRAFMDGLQARHLFASWSHVPSAL